MATSPLVGVQSIVISLSVCLSVSLSVRSHISKTTCPNFTKFSANVIGGSGSVLLWHYILPVFVGNVKFTHSGANGPESKTTRIFRPVLQVGRGISPHCGCQSLYFTMNRSSAPRWCPYYIFLIRPLSSWESNEYSLYTSGRPRLAMLLIL